MATTNSKLADVPKPTNGSDISSANILCVQNGSVTQIPGYLKKVSDNQKAIENLKTAVFDMIYPVGSYYWSSNATNPSSIFGGTWEQIKDRFVLAAGGTYTAGATGGEAAHTLSVNEIPSHTHSLESITGYDDMNFINGSNTFLLQNSDTTLNWPSAKEAKMMYGNTGATGGSAAHNNMPPYIVAYCWHRTA